MASHGAKLMCLFLILGLAAPSLAEDFVIGGWDLSSNKLARVSRKTYKVGDTLTFNFDPKLHNLVQVDLKGFTTCLPINIFSTYNSGKVTITLDKPGISYFISNLLGDCSKGLKIAITTVL